MSSQNSRVSGPKSGGRRIRESSLHGPSSGCNDDNLPRHKESGKAHCDGEYKHGIQSVGLDSTHDVLVLGGKVSVVASRILGFGHTLS